MNSILQNPSYLIFHYWKKREEYINIDYAVTVWMQCVIPHIREYVLVNTNEEHIKQVNVFIKTLFHEISDDEMNDTLDTFWSEYTDFNNKNGPFDGNDFIWSSKDILQDNINIWNQKYYLPCTKVIGFVACMVTYKIVGIGASECAWVDVKTIKSGQRSAIRRNLSEKHSNVYISAYI